ncbi:MAG: hypothetical protein II916_03125 [Oscillospiraceae bacterium]|nr:hypothetical protein [Oscillospiraceae bacterium]
MADQQKKPKEKSVLQIAKEMEAQQARIAEEQQELLRQKREEERKAYEEQLRQDRLELIRLKQGVIGESETIHEVHEEKPHYTVGQRIGNFFYHNKWWLGIAAFFAFTIGFIAYQTITTVKPDMIVLLLVHDDLLNAECNQQIGDLFAQYIGDENGDGKVVCDVYYIPASDETAERSGYTGDSTKLFAEFQTGEACIVISDEGADQFIVPDHTLVDLEEDFGDYEQTDGVRFYLRDTDFAKDIEWYEGDLDKDIYIGIRSVRQTLDSEEKMQETYDISYPALRKFIEAYGTKE